MGLFQQTDGTCEECGSDDSTVSSRSTSGMSKEYCYECYATELSDAGLGEREAEVYALSDSGYTNAQISDWLDIQESTVASHLASVRKKYAEASRLAQSIEPATSFSGEGNQFGSEFPEGLDPGAVIELAEPHIDPMDRSEYTHGIIRRVRRDGQGVPQQIAVYPFNPDTEEIQINDSRSLPTVVDNGHFGTVVFPVDKLLTDIPL